jgi:hypothetical protein
MSDTTDSGAAGPDDTTVDEVAYKLEDWDDESFIDAEEALRKAGINFRREGFDTLVVAPGDEEAVDAILDEVEEARAAELAERGEVPPGVDGERERSHDELVYELVDWSPEMRNQLSLVLEREGIAYDWEGTDLIIAAALEAQVDDLIDQMEQGTELAASTGDGDDEANYNVLSDLFLAADRLAADPSDLALCGDLADAAGPAQAMAAPFGVDETAWNRIQDTLRSALEAIETEAPDEVVATNAASWRDLLRGYV